MPIPDVTFALDDIVTMPNGDELPLRHVTHADLLDLARGADTPDRLIHGAARLIKVLSPGQKVDELAAEEFNDAYWRTVEPHRYLGSTVSADLEPLIAILPAPAVPERINDWPEDEQDFFRSGYSKEPGDGGWHDYTERLEILTRMRKEKLAEQIVTSDWFTAIAPEASARLAHSAQVEVAPKSKALRDALRAFDQTLTDERHSTPNITYLPSAELIERAEQLLRRLVLPDTPVPHIFTGQYGIGFTWGPSGNYIQVTVRDDQYGKYWAYYAASIAGQTEDRGEGEPPYLRMRELLRRVIASR
jgi:hypothetical protein